MASTKDEVLILHNTFTYNGLANQLINQFTNLFVNRGWEKESIKP